MSRYNKHSDSDAINWRARIEANLSGMSAQRVRALFEEINPHLTTDQLFESRWTKKRQPAAVLVPIVDRPGGATVLMTVRSLDMPSHAGQISFPGGKVEPGDATRIDTALREAREEVNIQAEDVTVIGQLGVHEGGLGFAVTPVIGIINPQAEIRPCPREVEEVFEAPLSYFVNLDNHIVEERALQGVKYNMFAAPYGRYNIWGLTAGILRTMAEVLQDDETTS